MRFIKAPEFTVLSNEKAIEALYDFKNELEEHRGEELTEKQTDALIKLAKGLISSMEAEKQAHIRAFFYMMNILSDGNPLTRALPVAKKETTKECPHFFGYLAEHPRNQSIPDECFGCTRAMECINKEARGLS